MRDPSLSPSSRLGGAVISDRIVSALLEELRTGRTVFQLYLLHMPVVKV